MVFIAKLKFFAENYELFRCRASAVDCFAIKIAREPLKGVFIITPWYLFINTNQLLPCCRYNSHSALIEKSEAILRITKTVKHDVSKLFGKGKKFIKARMLTI